MSDDDKLVDYVLIFSETNDRSIVRRRNVYIDNLRKKGLKLIEDDVPDKTNIGRTLIKYYKVYIPREVLEKYGEILQIRMPVKPEAVEEILKEKEKEKVVSDQLMADFLSKQPKLFDVDDPDFFKQYIRSAIANLLLNTTEYDEHEKDCIGLEKLIDDKIFDDAFPLHEGFVDDDEKSERAELLRDWGSFDKYYKPQPIDRIRNYFGIKVAIYFLWLGFYTEMLVYATVIGVICLIYGLATMNGDYLSNDICNSDYIMCPQCDTVCDYWKLSDSCTYSRITFLFDSDFTVFFAFCMSVWSTLFLEFWKRHCNSMTHYWGLIQFDLQNEYPRPEYLKMVRKKKGRISFWKDKMPNIFFSFGLATSVVIIALGAVFSVIVYRMAVRTSKSLYAEESTFSGFFIPVTAGVINLVAIFILNFIYERLANKLTEKEYQRTQQEFDNSLVIKIYIFQFINFYSSIFYIAFIKGNFIGYPGNYQRIFNFRQEECSPGGCLMELCIQLAIVMIGKQAANNVLEILLPYLQKVYKTTISKGEDGGDSSTDHQVYADQKLKAWTSRELYPEYLEMVIQYGFVTLFVTAFPLAPLFALINNIIEIRLDAKKFLTYYRRPVAERVKDIGVWYNIINLVGKLSVISNAFIIAFGSNFIPQLVYKMAVSPEFSKEGYLDFSLSVFDVKDLEDPPENSKFSGITNCSYSGFRTGPNEPDKYTTTIMYWHILAARLAFVVIYQIVVNLVIMAIKWAVPDVPHKVRKLIKKENKFIKNYLVKRE